MSVEPAWAGPGLWFAFYDEAGRRVGGCTYPYVGGCSAEVQIPFGASKSYMAYVAEEVPTTGGPVGVRASAGPVTVTHVGWPGSIESFTATPAVLDEETSQSRLLLQLTVGTGGTPYLMAIYGQNGRPVRVCSYPAVNGCAVTVTVPPGETRTYTAYVATDAPLDHRPTAVAASATVSVSYPTYVDPIPPPPDGHQIVDGYDLDEIAAFYDEQGGYEALALAAAAIPASHTLSGSCNDLCMTVLAMGAAGIGVGAILTALVDQYGTDILPGLASGDHGPGNSRAGNGTGPGANPGNGKPPLPVPVPLVPGAGHGNPGGPNTFTIEPGEATVNEVLRSWYRRIYEGRAGPSTVVATDPFDESAMRTAARQCLELAADAARAGVVFDTSNPCRDMRILFPAGSGELDEYGKHVIPFDAYGAAQHDLDAIQARPEWFQLNYMSDANKRGQVPRRWYESNPYASVSGCRKAPGMHCDEYPLYATTQGGPREYGGSGASLRPVNPAENAAEGWVYGAMASSSACSMESAPAVPRGVMATGGTPFLVVPLPGVPVSSFFVC